MSKRKLPLNFSYDLDFMDEIPIFNDSPARLPRNQEIQFISFPDEIIEIVFAFLPIHDILCSLTRVCRRFNALISVEKFLKYKKLYYRYNAGNRLFTDKERISIDLEIVDYKKFFDSGKCLENFIFSETIKDFKNLKEEVSNQILQRVRLTENFAICRRFFDKNESQKPSAWSYIAGCILVSENVDQITKLLKLLNFTPQITSKLYFLEFFYCVGLYVNLINNRLKILHRLSFNMYYSLFQFENDSTSILNQGLTHEQLRVVKHDLPPAHCMKIIALAGTGKTRTLIEYARARPHLNFLVIFYNSALAYDASERFPKNCVCLTIHAIAKRNVLLKHLENNIYVTHLSKIKNLHASVKGLPYYSALNLVKETLRTFFNSSEKAITILHCPSVVRLKDKTIEGSMKGVQLLYEQQKVIIETAERVWDKIQDVDDKEIPMFHDAYLKIFQLSKPDFRLLYPDVDIIMVDEAQDMNPTTIAIIKNQKYHPVIVVGDPHQQIYRFRGSCNALDVFPGSDVPCRTFYLTQSFRFGPNIAYVTNIWLKMKKKFGRILVGKRELGSHLTGTQAPLVKPPFTEAVLCRTNFGVFTECATITARDPSKSIHILGGESTLNLDALLDLYDLYFQGDNGPSPDHKPRTTFGKFCFSKQNKEDLTQYAVETQDNEILLKDAIIKMYGKGLPAVIDRLRKSLVPWSKPGCVIVSTTHKCKGLEFDVVRLASDFECEKKNQILVDAVVPFELEMFLSPSPSGHSPPNSTDDLEDEYNILYVAMTRARSVLTLNKEVLATIVQQFGENFQKICLHSTLEGFLRRQPDKKCIFCGSKFEPKIQEDAVVLYRPSLKITYDNQTLSSPFGLQCKMCLSANNSVQHMIIGGAVVAVIQTINFIKFASMSSQKDVRIVRNDLGNSSQHFLPFL